MKRTKEYKTAKIILAAIFAFTMASAMVFAIMQPTTQTASADGHIHNEITFTAWESTNSLPTSAGNYYLTGNVTLGGYWTVPSGTTNLCLNGYGIKTTSNRVIYINGGTLNLYDCGDATHYFNVNNNGQAQNINDESGDMSFTGGYITGGSGTSSGCSQTSLYWGEGGGVLVWSGTFNMYGGTILGNYAVHGGGVEVVNATMNMYGGDIIYNRCGEGGAGINLRSQSNNTATLNMFGGNVCYNKGTAIDTSYCYGNRSFNLSGGSISHNNGTGIWVNAVNISGEPGIEDNSGFGMYVDTNTAFNGKPAISNNVRGDLYVAKNHTITIAKTWENDSMSVAMANTTGVFTSGWSTYMGDADPTDYFFSANADYQVYRLEEEAAIRPHTHDLTYTVSGATITATCSVNGCALPDGKATLTISAPAAVVYDGTAKKATLSAYDTKIFPDAVIKYFVGNTEVSECINAGTCVAKVSVGGVTAEVSFTIEKTTPDYIIPTGLTAFTGDTLSDIELPAGWTWNDLTQDVGNVDVHVFKATFTPEDTDNYNIVENIDVEVIVSHAHSLTYTVSGATITATCSADFCTLTDGKSTLTINAPTGDLVYDGTAKTANLSEYDTTIFSDAVIKYFVGDTEVSECINAGTYVAKVSVGGVTAEISFTIKNWAINKEDKGVVVEIEGSEEQADITVEVEVKTDVSSKQSQADYSKVAGEKLGNNEKVAFVYDVKLIRTEIIGGVETKTEIQPSDIKAGTTIVVRMDVPTELRGKTFKVLHIHSDEDVEFVEFTKSDDGSYITVRTAKLSEFAFVIEDVSAHGFCLGWFVVILDISVAIYLAAVLLLKNKKILKFIGLCCSGAVLIFAIIILILHVCYVSIIGSVLALILFAAFLTIFFIKKKDDGTKGGNADEPANETDATDATASQNKDSDFEEDKDEEKFVMDASGNIFNIRYKKSFLAKLIQSSDETKAYYSELKNEVLAYNKIKSSVSWAYDSVNAGRSQVLKFAIRGKTLCIYFALNPDDYADSKYKVEKADAAKYQNVPCMYRIKNDRRAKYATDLIAAVCAKYGLLKGEVPADDYTLPYETTDALIGKGLIKELKVVATNEQIQRAKAAGKVDIAEGTLQSTADEDDENVLVVDAKGNIFNIRYNKSFKAKLIQSSDEIKAQYTELKNEILSYKKTGDRLSWSFDSINSGRTQIVKFAIRGKTLCVCFALNADDYADTKYKVEKVESKKYEAVPCLYRIKNERRLGYAKDLFAAVAEKNGLIKGETPSVDYYLPYETTESLIKQELIKELKTVATNEQIQRAKSTGKIQYVSQVSVQEANAMISDEVAATMIEGHIGGAVGKKDIVNVDVLSKNYNDGETVTIDSLKEKKLVPQSAKQVKLLARGVLDKKLNVELQDYSIEAVKMVIATGGTVHRAK